jgi:hypothetical protein
MLEDPRRIVVLDSPPGASPALSAVLPMIDLPVAVLLADGGSACLLPQIADGRFLGRGTLASRAAERMVLALNQMDLQAALPLAVLDCAESVMTGRLLGVVARDAGVAEALADRRLPMQLAGSRAAEDLALLADSVLARLALPRPAATPARSIPTFRGLRR